jgi:trimethylamine:corrinoid methyltransferase-like protein
LLAGVLLVELSFGTPNCGRSELLLDPLVWLPVVAAGALAAAGVPCCEAGCEAGCEALGAVAAGAVEVVDGVDC